jgi:hypothetical protein
MREPAPQLVPAARARDELEPCDDHCDRLFWRSQGRSTRGFRFLNVYGAGGCPIADESVQVMADIMQDIEGLRSVGIATPSQTGCAQSSHRQSAAFDIVELNGTPVSGFTEPTNISFSQLGQ